MKIKGIAPQPKNNGEQQPHHYPEFLTAGKCFSAAQDWAHHAFSGGHIDLMRQGVHQGPAPIYEYDLCSAYPAEIVNLPSMRDGKYVAHTSRPAMTLQEIKTFIEPMNMLSMIEVHWRFQFERRELSSKEMLAIANNPEPWPKGCHRPDGSLDNDLLYAKVEEAKGEPLPYYPLFYRVNGEGGMIDTSAGKGAVLYPPSGEGRYYRAEVLAAIAWCERFPHAMRKFEFHGAQEFIEDKKIRGARPFAFIQEMFDERSQIVADTGAKKKVWKAGGEIGPEPYDIREKALKLIMNSVYGKMAQSIGTRSKLPNCTNPFYAGAITAGTRAKLLLASLHNPHGIIFFATDAITSMGPLESLEIVQEKVLGEWEHAADIDVAKGAVFNHPGIYSFFDLKGDATLKMRGCKIEFGREFMMKQVRANFKRGDRPHPVTGEPANVIYFENKSLITLGLAVSSPEDWKQCGTWKTQKRELNLNSVGIKRGGCNNRLRANELVFIPAMENYEEGLSAPYYPDWLLCADSKNNAEERDAEELTDNQIRSPSYSHYYIMSLLYLASPGIGLSTRRGLLFVCSEGDDEQSFPPHNHRLQCVIAANKGFVSFDALAWLAREHVALLIYNPGGVWQVIADTPAGRLSRQELALRERQMRCVFNPQARLTAARALVAAKLDALTLISPSKGPAPTQEFARKLAKAQTMADVLSHEAKHAEAYWRLWQGQEIAIHGECPAAWRVFKTRTRTWRTGRLGEGGAQFSNRFALTPVNAMLNFSGAIIAAQCGRACTGLGLDPAFGVLHSSRPGMAALAWDCHELLRAKVAEAVFKFCDGSRNRIKIKAEWFKIEPKPRPHVRFIPDIARPLAAWTVKAVPWKSVVNVVKQVAELLS